MRAVLRNASLLFNPMHVLHERRAGLELSLAVFRGVRYDFTISGYI